MGYKEGNGVRFFGALIKPEGETMAYLMAKGGRQEGECFEITSKKSTIGSDFECDIMLEDPSVSKEHAIVFLAPDGSFRILDNNSQRGMIVNGKKVLRTSIKENDVIRLGASTLVVYEGPMPQQNHAGGFESVFAAPKPKPPEKKSPAGSKPPGKKTPPLPRRPGAPLPKRPAPRRTPEQQAEMADKVLDAVDSQRTEATRQKAYKTTRSTGFFPRRTWMIVGGLFGIIIMIVAVAYLLLANKRFDDGKGPVKIVINYEGKGLDLSKAKKPKGFKADNVKVEGDGAKATQLKTMSKGGNMETNDSSSAGSSSSGKSKIPEPTSGGSGAGLQGDGEASLSNKKSDDKPAEQEGPTGEKQVFEETGGGGAKGDDILDKAEGKDGLDRDDLRKKIGNVGPKGRGSDYELKDFAYQDPDMIDESYTYDDGANERSAFVSGSSGVIALSLTPTYYPANLVEVSLFIDYNPWCCPFEIVVMVDDSGTGPNNARTVFTSKPIRNLFDKGWFTFDLGEAGFTDPLYEGEWIVGIRALGKDGLFVGLDGSTAYPTSYQFDPKTKSWDLAGLAEIPMIRGAGTYPSSITY